jgi:archaetidylinositol phosphate synthase
MLGQIRAKTKKIFLKCGKKLSFLPITPNQFTLLAVPLAIAAAYFFSEQKYFFALIFVLLAILIDVLDGSFATAKNKKTPFGNYFDAVTDKIVESIFYFGFVTTFPLAGFLAFAGTMLNSYAKPRIALVIETNNHDWPAIGERADRLLLLIAGTIVASIYSFAMEFILYAIFVMTIIGFVQRIFYAKKLIKIAEKEGKILKYIKEGK